jgi:formate-dependent nitrite reductase cytochrome c552 subunit
MAMVLACLLFASTAARAQTAPPVWHPPPAPVQPVSFSHYQHIALGLTCLECHVNPGAGKLMTYPVTALCSSCHDSIPADRSALQKLAAFAASGQPIPWVRVYQLPDYVYWQHASHLQADVQCVDCHGPVADRDVTAQETNIVTMKGCTTCHDKRQVLTDCGDCHEPRQ